MTVDLCGSIQFTNDRSRNIRKHKFGNEKKILANICLFTTAIIWGFAFVAQVLGSDSLDPFSFNAIRFGVGGVSLVPVIFLLERRPRGKNMQAKDNTADRKKLKNTVIAAAV